MAKKKRMLGRVEEGADEDDGGTVLSARDALKTLRKKAKDKSLDEEEDDLPADFWDISDSDENEADEDAGGRHGPGDWGDEEDDDDDDDDDEGAEDDDPHAKKKADAKEEPKSAYERFMEKSKEERRQEKAVQKGKTKPIHSEFGEALKHSGITKTAEEAVQDGVKQDDQPRWYDSELPLRPASLNTMASLNLDMEQLKTLYREGEDSLFAETEKQKKAEPWIFDKVAKAGTTRDKIAALALQLSRPNIETRLPLLEQMLALAAKKDKKQQKEAGEVLTALWLSHVLPKKRKLKEFVAQPFEMLPEDAEARTKVLQCWYFEDRVKNLYKHFVTKVMSAGMSDPTPFLKLFWLTKCFALLNHVPEQENLLLSLLCDKLGDVSSRVAAKALRLLQFFLREHPRVVEAVAQELERFLFRAHNRVQARRYATLVLNSVALRNPGPALAQRLLKIYLVLFKQLVVEANVEHSLMHILIRGMSRVVAYLPQQENLPEYYDALFTVASSGSYNHRITALGLLFQLVERFDAELHRRFFQSLYRFIAIKPHVMPQNERLVEFFALVYKALVYESTFECQVALIHRLLQMCQHQRPTYICCVLLLLSELCVSMPQLRDLIVGPKSPQAEDLEEPYNPSHMIPFFAHAASEAFWLLERLTHHFHPVVVKFALQLGAGLRIEYAGSPLLDFSGLRFLDHFVYRVPKVNERRMRALQRPRATLTYNSKEFRQLPPEQVEMDELFFYKYARLKHDRDLEALANMTAKRRHETLLATPAPTDKPDTLAELMDDFEETEEHVDVFNRFSYDDLRPDDVGGNEDAGDEDESDFDISEDSENDRKAKPANRAQRRALANKFADQFDVRGAALKSRSRDAEEYIQDAADFDQILEEGRKAVQNAQKRRGAKRQKTRGDDDF